MVAVQGEKIVRMRRGGRLQKMKVEVSKLHIMSQGKMSCFLQREKLLVWTWAPVSARVCGSASSQGPVASISPRTPSLPHWGV